MPHFSKRVHKSKLSEAIKETAWEQISVEGAPGLSLRAIARKLGITAPAIYNYYPDRDALVTALIIDAFSSFGDSQLEANNAIRKEDLFGRMHAIGIAYRSWAIEHPQRYQLIFGTPIPGYIKPKEQIMPSGARSLRALVSVIEELRLKDKLKVHGFPEIQLVSDFEFGVWQKYGGQVDILSLSVATLIWSRVHGLVSLEIGGYLPPFGASPEALYNYELNAIHDQFVKD